MVLAHHGTKGMKWGVRKDAGHEGESAKTSKIAKLDKKFEGNRALTKAYYETWNTAAKQMNAHDIARINNKPQYKDQDFTKDTPLRRKYYQEHEKAFLNNLEKASAAKGTNASGTKKYTIHEFPNGSWKVTTTDVKHDDGDSFVVNVNYDSNGYITNVDIPNDDMAQGADLVADVLAHHGIKGMKWGIRKGSSESSSTDHASPDHLEVEAHKTKAREHGVKALSNQDLQTVLTRMDLENRLNTHQKNKKTNFDTGHNHVKKVLAVAKTLNEIHTLAKSPVGKAVKTAYKAKKVAGV